VNVIDAGSEHWGMQKQSDAGSRCVRMRRVWPQRTPCTHNVSRDSIAGMPLTLRAFALGSLLIVSLGCNAPSASDAPPAPSPVQSAKAAEPLKAPATAEPAREASNALCLAVCRKAGGLNCGAADECSSGCQEMLSVPNCQTVMVAFLECLSKEPLEHWECDTEAHIPGIRDGYCEAQQNDVARCVGNAT
jgi:hypothetical protein